MALVALSSWSHAFLTPKNWLLYPDVPADRALYDALQRSDYKTWRERPLSAVEDSGQQEILNWMCLHGRHGRARPAADRNRLVELRPRNKCFAVYEP